MAATPLRPDWVSTHAADQLGALSRLSKKTDDPLFGLNENDPTLLEICSTCTYPPDGCDFRNPQVDKSMCSPCGGLQAIAGLNARGS